MNTESRLLHSLIAKYMNSMVTCDLSNHKEYDKGYVYALRDVLKEIPNLVKIRTSEGYGYYGRLISETDDSITLDSVVAFEGKHGIKHYDIRTVFKNVIILKDDLI